MFLYGKLAGFSEFVELDDSGVRKTSPAEIKALYDTRLVQQIFKAEVFQALREYFTLKELLEIMIGCLELVIDDCWAVRVRLSNQRISLSLATG